MSKELAILQNNITDIVLENIQGMEKQNDLHFPTDYSYQNALKSAWLILQETQDRNKKPALEVCTKESVATALLDMVIQGLSPGKKQCYFIVYGDKLTLLRSYFGSISVAKRVTDLVDITAEVIREGQEFIFDVEPKTGNKFLVKHEMPFNTLNSRITGAYAIKKLQDGSLKMEIMTKEDILKAWGQGATKGGSPAHKNFEAEMCKKTVINRACKIEINSSSDSDVVIAAVNRSTASEYENNNAEMAVSAEAREVEETEALKDRIKKNALPEPAPPAPKEKTKIIPPYSKMKKAISDGKAKEVYNNLNKWEWPKDQKAELLRLIIEADPGLAPTDDTDAANEQREMIFQIAKWSKDTEMPFADLTGNQDINSTDDLEALDIDELKAIYDNIKSQVE